MTPEAPILGIDQSTIDRTKHLLAGLKPTRAPDPTATTYATLNNAYDFFNRRLFEGRLPRCLITIQRSKKCYGYFAANRFGAPDGQSVTDEIALNPTHFASRTHQQTLSTLVHEMTHLEQQHFGKPSKGGYHNAEWAEMMRRVGLVPSNTGQPGGKPVGPKMSHYIEANGRFDLACIDLMRDAGFRGLFIDLWDEAKAKKKAASKTKYTCPDCGFNAWAKPDTSLICGTCFDEDGESRHMTEA
jgi:hypothetical protein